MGPPYCWAEMYADCIASHAAPGKLRWVCQWDGQTNGRQTITLCFPLYAAWFSRGIFTEAVRTFNKAKQAEAAEMLGKAEAVSLLVEGKAANAQVMGFVLVDP